MTLVTLNAERQRHPAALVCGLLLAALLFAVPQWLQSLPLNQLAAAAFSPSPENISQLLFHYSTLPRFCMALLAGMGFSLAGLLFQQTLRNPLADPTTFGVSAGAQLMLTVAAVWLPSLLRLGQEMLASLGGLLAALLIVMQARRQSTTPQSLTLSGLMLTLYAGCLASVIGLLSGSDLQGIFIWSSGALEQNSWHGVRFLLPRLLIALLLAVMLLRAMNTFALHDTAARSLGVPVQRVRMLALLLGTLLCASVMSVTGIIGFIGMAAPVLVRLGGARRLAQQLLWTPLMGGALLLLTDQLAQWLARWGFGVPTGTLTALLGAPLLIWLIPRLKQHSLPKASAAGAGVRRAAAPRVLWPMAAAVATLLLLALCFGRVPGGWAFSWGTPLDALLSLRGPRVLGAACAGAMLGVAGVLVQRLTANPMSSPELLGISSGASLGVMLTLLVAAAATSGLLLAGAGLGALLALVAMLLTGRRAAFSADKLLLTGIGLSTVINAVTALMMTTITPQTMVLQDWLAGSTYRILPGQAVALAGLALVLTVVALLHGRWLLLLSLGDDVARGQGVPQNRARGAIVILTALLTAAATLLVGPLTFAGLMAPHLARMSGLQRPVGQMLGAALGGAGIMLLADWLGRNLIYPQQLPAGLLATFIGAPWHLLLMRRKP
ncbi:Fe(3+)-hydroxamate ABC transporter permease FhuB [Erwinia sp. INIA-01]|uniref:Fe(3+)-hydroxamate ABC transporter permease FhuB n=1 Tax=Erwinia sp. INIA01 TaxID=2991500 RepID=UPI0022250BF1|nr:Fe(3+)-hydroxamate ABC transporter permease FhuB [Erwinia sp. INIA01]MCW1875057.1 Fe(3+)-hydroxamate ABC transporter permease FhuB [Erwinia sp. INIA01]